jgi:alcohol dehydrogenase class IV
MFESFNFYMPTEVYFGRGILKSKAKHLKKTGTRAFVVTGANSGRLSGALQDCENALKELNISYKVFEGIENNPSVEQCIELSKLAKGFNADFVIGIGGGSPMDAAKAIAVFVKNDITAEELFVCSTIATLSPTFASRVFSSSTTNSSGEKLRQALQLLHIGIRLNFTVAVLPSMLITSPMASIVSLQTALYTYSQYPRIHMVCLS